MQTARVPADVRIILIEDSPHFRSSLRSFFRHAPGFELVSIFGSAEAALSEVKAASLKGELPDWQMALMDIELPGISGIEATRRLKEKMPEIHVVMMTVFEEPSVIVEAISAGADGYLLKKTSARELRDQLRSIASGGAPLTAEVARTLVDIVRASPVADAPPPARLELSPREQEALRCLVRGMTYQQVADELGVSLDTVRTFIRRVYKKLQVHSVAEAVQRAIRERLV